MKIKELIFEDKEFPEELKKEVDVLQKLGVEGYEIGYLIYLKIKEEIIIRKI